MKKTFKEIDIGEKFFDNFSGDYYEKVSENSATNMEYGNYEDSEYFEKDEIVETLE